MASVLRLEPPTLGLQGQRFSFSAILMLWTKKLKYKSTQNKWRYSFQFYSTLAQLVLLATLLVTYTVFYRTKAEFINMMEMHFIEWLVRTIRHNPNRMTHRYSHNISDEQIIKFKTIEYSLEILIRIGLFAHWLRLKWYTQKMWGHK